MAQKKIMRHASGKKALRQSKKRHALNVQVKSKIRTLAKNVSKALSEKNVALAKETLAAAQAAWKKAANKGVVHKNAASRTVSRLASRLAVLAKA